TQGVGGGRAVIDAIVCSPPYADQDTGASSPRTVELRNEALRRAAAAGSVGPRYAEMARTGQLSGNTQLLAYGRTPGQRGTMQPGTTEEAPVDVEPVVWPMRECYGQQWGSLLVPEAMAHPAKFSRLLIFKIVRHCLDNGWLRPGDLVADPFGGVGLGGIACAY